ncbi:hypothetical protein ABKN59_011853 [Abortiporus biennis]
MAFFTEEAILDPPYHEVVDSTTAAPQSSHQNPILLSLDAASALKNPRPQRRKFRRSKGGSLERVGGGLVVASTAEKPSSASVEDDWSDRWHCRSDMEKSSSIQTHNSEKVIQG